MGTRKTQDDHIYLVHNNEGEAKEEGVNNRAWGGLILVWFFCIMSGPVFAKDLTTAEERGKKIYFSGSNQTGGAAAAYFGEDQLEVSAELLTCASCHGYDGLGRPESGLEPFNITWKYLTKAYGHVHSSGLQHPPFTEQNLKEFLWSGIYPGGARGDRSMPIYNYSDADLTDLISFLKRLGTLPAPGVRDDTITVGTVLPAQGSASEIGASVEQLLKAYFSEVNRNGGIYGRKIELLVSTATLTGPEAPAALTVPTSDIFVLLSTLTPGLDLDFQTFWSERQVPLVAPLTFYPLNEFKQNRYSFFLYSGLREQLQALFQSRDEELFPGGQSMAAVYLDNPENRWVLESLEKVVFQESPQFRKIPLTQDGTSLNAAVDSLQKGGVGLVLLLVPEEQTRDFLQKASQKDYRPSVVLPGGLPGNLPDNVGSSFANRLFSTYPDLPQDLDPEGLKEFSRLLNLYNIKPTHPQAQTAAFVAAKLTVEGLRKSGRQLDRAKFVSALESLYKFKTGLTHPVSYGQNQRVGIYGTYLVVYKGPGYSLSDLAKNAKWKSLGRQ